MSSAKAWCRSSGSTESPISLTPRRSNSGLSSATEPSSVAQTGVKSLGCEKSTAHESPIHSWKRMRPSVVSASKSGATLPSCNIRSPFIWCSDVESTGCVQGCAWVALPYLSGPAAPETEARCRGGRVAPGRHLELPQDRRHVVLDGLGRDHELRGDLAVLEPAASSAS